MTEAAEVVAAGAESEHEARPRGLRVGLRALAAASLPGTRVRVATIVHWLAIAAYLAVFVHQARAKGLPLDRWRIQAWIVAFLAATCVGRSWRNAVSVLRDWFPFLLLLLAYDYTLGFAYRIDLPLRVLPQLEAERFVFRGVPSVWWQERLLPQGIDATPLRWWEFPLTMVYVTHFVVPYVLAALLRTRDRVAWRKYTAVFAMVTAGAVVTFALLPTAPPWMAASRGLIAPLERPVGRGWQLVSVRVATTLFDEGRASLNPVAAVPSLHGAYSLLVSLTLWPRVRRFWRPVLVAYPIAMLFVLVYGGEHYAVDVFAGWAYVGLAYVALRRIGRWSQARRATATPLPLVLRPLAHLRRATAIGDVVSSPRSEGARRLRERAR